MSVTVSPSSPEEALVNELARYLPAARLARYEHACAGTDVAAVDLHQWASHVALAAFEDVSRLEVVLRSRMSEALAGRYGLRWYERADLFDDDTLRLISTAWGQGGLTALTEQAAEDQVVHGKLIASFTFGFWVKLLGRGSYQGKRPFRVRRIYDTTLWRPALVDAFPHAVDRGRVERAAHHVQALRNRVAHHEHII